MPNVSRSRSDARFRRTWSSRWKRFKEWAKRLFLYGRLDWRRASDDATPLRLTAQERAALEPKFEVQAIRPRSVSAADLAPTPEPPAPTVLPPQTQNPGLSPAGSALPIDPAILAAALSAVQQQTAAGNRVAVDPAQVAAALEALQAAGIAPSAPPPAEGGHGVRTAEELRAAERDHARRYKRRRKSRSSRAHINPLTAFDSDNLPPSALEARVEKWFKR